MIFTIFLFLQLLNCLASDLDLSGEWSLRGLNSSLVLHNCRLPGGVHECLIKNKIIEDPYLNENDDKYRWVALEDFEFHREFFVKENKGLFLRASQLDTIALISLNGKELSNTSNQFRLFRFNLDGFLNFGSKNTISIVLKSAVNQAEINSANYFMDIPPDSDPGVQHGFNHRNFIRKEASSFSWDWGPGFAPLGIWDPLVIERFDHARIISANVVPELLSPILQKSIPLTSNTTTWKLNISANIYSLSKTQAKVKVLVGELFSHEFLNVDLAAGDNLIPLYVDNIENISLWWPRGYGSPTLYDVIVSCEVENETSTFKTKTGFRIVELVQEKEIKGHSFFFSVNNVPIFVKGSNWIPADAFQNRITKERIQFLLTQIYNANINLVRNWGGGRYEVDEFYEFCDEKGILVWQEFMFACAMYPSNGNFLDEVREEVQDQVTRLMNHPSLILWSGNNENEVAIAQNWYNIAKDKIPTFIDNYNILYNETVRATVLKLDSSRSFISSSPSNGIDTPPDGISVNPQDEFSGDAHYYNYDMNCFNGSAYPIPRFASEYGFQSYPSFLSLQEAIPNLKEEYFNSSNILHRQHHTDGNSQMTNQVKFHFQLPTNAATPAGLRSMLYLAQITHGLCLRQESEHYRRQRGIYQTDNRGNTMGVIYWQANDIWQGASWSSLEYNGKWKPAHHYAKEFFEDVIVSPVGFESDTLDIFVVNDLLLDIPNSYVTLQVWKWESPIDQGPTIEMTSPIPFTVPAACSSRVFTTSIDSLLSINGLSRNNSVVVITLSSASDESLHASNIFYPSTFIDALPYIQKPKLSIVSIDQISNEKNKKSFNICIQGSYLSPFVWLETFLEGEFSTNGFLLTSSTKCVIFVSAARGDNLLGFLRQSLKVSSLMDVYNDENTSNLFFKK